jgi:putative glycosyltransferase (TIGR04372 family)
VKESLKNILDFCVCYDKIICYGAAHYGHLVKHFLEVYGIKVDFFVVSEKKCSDEVERNGTPILSISELGSVLINEINYGMILSLSERYHEDVKDTVQGISFGKIEFFPITMEVADDIYGVVMSHRRKQQFQFCGIDEERKLKYQCRMEKIVQTYDKVLVQNTNMPSSMGSMGSWAMYCCFRQECKDRIFQLYYPCNIFEQNEDRDSNLKGANSYLMGKFHSLGIEVLSKDNIDFWRWLFHKTPELFLFDDEYRPFEIICNERLTKKVGELNEIYINFTQEEKHKGEYLKNQFGIKNPYVCISARDSLYWAERKGMKCEEIIDDYRNSNILKRKKAVKYLQEKSIQVVRMGAIVEKKEDIVGVIDYASKFRNEFMDVYLGANCKFFASDLGGIQTLAELFSKPMVITNVTLLSVYGDTTVAFNENRDIAIIKKFWDERNKRYLSIRELLKYEIGYASKFATIRDTLREYQKKEIIAIENTEEEIYEVIKEMNERIDGIREYDELDKILQKKYFQIINEYSDKGNVILKWRLGADFLRKNQWLLD